MHSFVGLAVLLTCCCCAGPQAALALGPAGHGQHTSLATPAAIGWRSNALAAPCELRCSDGAASRGISCDCRAIDTIYMEHLEATARAHAQALGESPLRQ